MLKQIGTYFPHKIVSVRYQTLVQKLGMTGLITLQLILSLMLVLYASPYDHMVAAEAPGIMTCSNQQKQDMLRQLLLYPFTYFREAKAFSKMPAHFCFCLLTTVVSLDQS